MASTERTGPWSGKPKELYYRLMTPKWLANDPEVKWDCEFEKGDLDLKIKTDARDYERIFYVQLLDKKHFKPTSDVTVKIRVGLRYVGPPTKPDPISFTVSDGSHAFGFQILDLTGYNTAGKGPYLPIEGSAGHYNFSNPTIQTDLAWRTTDRTNWPRVFEMRLKPMDGFGTCYTAIDSGHMISATFQELDPSKNGLWLETYRGDDKEEYSINFVEVTVTDTHA